MANDARLPSRNMADIEASPNTKDTCMRSVQGKDSTRFEVRMNPHPADRPMPTYTDLRLVNLQKHLKPCIEIATTLLENAPNSHDFRLLLDNLQGVLRQVEVFRKKHEGEAP